MNIHVYKTHTHTHNTLHGSNAKRMGHLNHICFIF